MHPGSDRPGGRPTRSARRPPATLLLCYSRRNRSGRGGAAPRPPSQSDRGDPWGAGADRATPVGHTRLQHLARRTGPSIELGLVQGYTIGYIISSNPEEARLATLPNAPLAIVALELRYPEQPNVLAPQAWNLIRDILRPVLPLMEKVTEETIEFGPNNPAPLSSRRTFPKFVNRTRTTALVVNPTVAVLETTIYEGYEKFRTLIEETVTALAAALRPDGIVRVGVRYIDEIRVPAINELPGDWSGYIDQHFLATVDPDLLKETNLTPEHWQGLVRYSTGVDSVLQVRYGPADGYAVNPTGPTRRTNAPLPGPFFLLDSDSFWEPRDEVPEFSVEAVLEACDRLHPPTRAIFNAVSEPRLVEEVYSRVRQPAVG